MGKNAAWQVTVMIYRWLGLRLDAPLMSFGGIVTDQIGPTRDFPATSMLTGLIGNALGLHWQDRRSHQSIQDRLCFAASRAPRGSTITDSQNAQLSRSDRGWTTLGEPERRTGGIKSFSAAHRRFRDYHADLSVRVVLRLRTAEAAPTLGDVAAAIDMPARPLFIGRKPCLPAAPMLAEGAGRWVTASTAHAALCTLVTADTRVRAQWPVGEGPERGENVERITDIADLRNWHTGLHAGWRRVVEGWVLQDRAA